MRVQCASVIDLNYLIFKINQLLKKLQIWHAHCYTSYKHWYAQLLVC
jgi:hypothetical protein